MTQPTQKLNVLVCGGAGYIGSHAVLALREAQHNVIVLDNLEKGHKKAIPSEVAFYEGDLRDSNFVHRVFDQEQIDAVIDFAAYSLVGESVLDPLKYYENNLYGTLQLLIAMKNNGVKHLVFSSTAAVYGEPEQLPITETAKTTPTSPYGETKLAVENMLKWADAAYGIKSTCLRYFNVAGAHPSGTIGEDHSPETHLIPNVLAVALLQKPKLDLMGDDYPTKDGTCIRDYIHVTDLANAHILALSHMIKTNQSQVFNLGNGVGFSNKDIILAAEKVTGIPIPYEVKPRRQGDPAVLQASSEKIMNTLGWKPVYSDLETIIKTAWAWHKNHPQGYNK